MGMWYLSQPLSSQDRKDSVATSHQDLLLPVTFPQMSSSCDDRYLGPFLTKILCGD